MSLPDGLDALGQRLQPHARGHPRRAHRPRPRGRARRAGHRARIEIELGQMWRVVPRPSGRRGRRLSATGSPRPAARVSIVGVSIDDLTRGRRRTDDERLAFLEPQLRARGPRRGDGRAPADRSGRAALLDGLLPLLEELDLVLYEEAQGHETPAARRGGPRPLRRARRPARAAAARHQHAHARAPADLPRPARARRRRPRISCGACATSGATPRPQGAVVDAAARGRRAARLCTRCT